MFQDVLAARNAGGTSASVSEQDPRAPKVGAEAAALQEGTPKCHHSQHRTDSFSPPGTGTMTLEKDRSTETRVTEALRSEQRKANATQAPFPLFPNSRCSEELGGRDLSIRNGFWPPTLARELPSSRVTVTRETPPLCAGDQEVK